MWRYRISPALFRGMPKFRVITSVFWCICSRSRRDKLAFMLFECEPVFQRPEKITSELRVILCRDVTRASTRGPFLGGLWDFGPEGVSEFGEKEKFFAVYFFIWTLLITFLMGIRVCGFWEISIWKWFLESVNFEIFLFHIRHKLEVQDVLLPVSE